MITGINLEALHLAAQGLTSTQIARELQVAEETVKSRLKAARKTLGASNTTHAVSIAHTAGLFGTPILDALPCPRCQRADLALIPREDAP